MSRIRKGQIRMVERRRIVTPGEQDAHTSWRRLYCYLARPGIVKKIKRQTNKRERRERQRDTERQVHEER